MVNLEMLEYGLMVTLLGMGVVFFVLGINWAIIKLITVVAGDSGKPAAAKVEKPDKDVAAAIAAAVRMYEKEEKPVR